MSAVAQAEQPVLLRADLDGIATLTLNRPQQMNLLTGEMLEFCRSRLARFKVPRAVVFGELPKTSTGKIQKFILRDKAKSATAIDT